MESFLTIVNLCRGTSLRSRHLRFQMLDITTNSTPYSNEAPPRRDSFGDRVDGRLGHCLYINDRDSSLEFRDSH